MTSLKFTLLKQERDRIPAVYIKGAANPIKRITFFNIPEMDLKIFVSGVRNEQEI
jgi:hypothetical protein